MGQVYIVGRLGSQFVKVGATRKTDATERIKAIRPIDGPPLVVLARWDCGGQAFVIERCIHRQLAAFRRRGPLGCTEWFQCDVATVVAAYQEAIRRHSMSTEPDTASLVQEGLS